MDPKNPQVEKLPPPQIDVGSLSGKRIVALRITIPMTIEAATEVADALRAAAQQSGSGIIVPGITVRMDGEKDTEG